VPHQQLKARAFTVSGTLTGVARELILTGLVGGDNKALSERLMQIERRLVTLESLGRDVSGTAERIEAVAKDLRHCKVVAQFRSVAERRTSLPPLLYVASKGLASRPGSSRRTAAEEARTYGVTRMRVLWSTCGLCAAEGAAGVWR
jgi:hypothetical protein